MPNRSWGTRPCVRRCIHATLPLRVLKRLYSCPGLAGMDIVTTLVGSLHSAAAATRIDQ